MQAAEEIARAYFTPDSTLPLIRARYGRHSPGLTPQFRAKSRNTGARQSRRARRYPTTLSSSATVLLRELRPRGYASGYTILKNWLQPQRASAGVVAVRRFETAPGKQA